MKKLLAFLLAVLMLLSLAACSEPDEDKDRDKDDERIEQTDPEESTEPEKQKLTAPEDYAGQVLVDNDVCRIEIKKITMDFFWGYAVNVSVENKTDKNVYFSVDGVSVNGLMYDPLWAVDVAAGETKEDENIYFTASELEAMGIYQVADITFQLSVTDSDDWMADPLLEDWFSIHPLGEDAVAKYCTRENPEGEVLLDDENCTVIVTGYDPEGDWGYTVNLYLVNKTQKTLMISTSDVLVNSLVCDPLWATDIAPGKASVTELYWYEETLEENDLSEITKIDYTLQVYDYNEWFEPLSEISGTLYPLGQDAAVDYVREPRDTDVILVDNEDVAVIVTGTDPDNLFGYSLKLYIVNKTDTALTCSVEEATVNGISLDPYWAADVPAGSQCYSELFWWSSELEEHSITEVTDIQLNFMVYEADDWLREDIIWSDTVQLNP